MACFQKLGILTCLVVSGCQVLGTSSDCSHPSSPVSVQRDEWGVPHIRAKTLADAAYGQGYAQAQDRLLQMDLLRRTAAGTRSELLGESELDMDKLVRTLGLRPAANASMGALSKETLCWASAYSGGVNQFIEDMVQGSNGAKRSASMTALDPDYVPPAWQPIDVVMIATAATFSLSSNLVPDLVLTAARLLMGDELYNKIVHFAPLVESFTIQDPSLDRGIVPLAGRDKQQLATALAEFAKTAHQLRDNLGPYSSNNWAISGDRTKRGFSMLASDPHGGITVSSSFHEIHMMVEKPEINAYGIAVIGGPMVHIGHNGKAAWAFTNYGADVGDLYEEVLDPDDSDFVLRDGQRIGIETRQESILVRPVGGSIADSKSQLLEVRLVPGHGPVLNEVLPEPMPILFSGKLITYRWVGAEDTLEARALSNLINVTTWQQFLTNAEDWHVGAQNTVFADVQGNIGYHATGRFPGRPWLSDELGPVEPLPGDGQAEWQGFDPFASIRTLFNPSWGFVASANADPDGFTLDDDPFNPEYLGYVFDFGFRTDRIKSELSDLLTGEPVLADMELLQTDVYVGLAELLMPRIQQAFARNTTDIADKGLVAAVKELAAWDYQATVSSTGSALFHPLIVHLIGDTIAEPVLAPLRPLLLGDAQFGLRALVHLLREADPVFFPDGVDLAIVDAFDRAVIELKDFFATTDMTQWTWGNLHVRELEHPLGGAFNLGPVPSQGGFAVVNRSDFSYLNEDGPAALPYKIVDGPDMRFIVELEAGTWTTRIMLPHGSSGDPDSSHYSDQFDLWVKGHYRTAHYLPEDVDNFAKTMLILK